MKHNWTMYVKPDMAKIKTSKVIKMIRYKLHPTFAQPVRDIKKMSPNGSYELTSNSWGSFVIEVNILLQPTVKALDGFEQKDHIKFDHMLQFIPQGSHLTHNLQIPKEQAKKLGLV